MATFEIREDSGKKVTEEERGAPLKVARGLAQQPQGPRVALRCVTNANGAAEPKRMKLQAKEADTKKTGKPKNGEINPSLNLDCLKLVGKENIPFSGAHSAERRHYRADDIVCAIEYGADIWNYLCQIETTMQMPKVNYMSKQTELTLEMRTVLIDWLVMVAEEYKVSEQAIHLSVNYIDRFLSFMSVTREKFQLVGAAAMMLALKVEEVDVIEAEEWVYLTGQAYTVRQITRMEQLLLKILKFEMNPPTSVIFIEQLCMAHNLDRKTMFMAMYLSELVLLEGEAYLQYLPSTLGVASIVLARYTLYKKNPCYKKIESFSGYKLQQLKPVITQQHRAYLDSPTKDQQAIQNKYKTDKYDRVALLTPRALNLEEINGEESWY